jgi:hypothetical protein
MWQTGQKEVRAPSRRRWQLADTQWTRAAGCLDRGWWYRSGFHNRQQVAFECDILSKPPGQIRRRRVNVALLGHGPIDGSFEKFHRPRKCDTRCVSGRADEQAIRVAREPAAEGVGQKIHVVGGEMLRVVPSISRAHSSPFALPT